MLLGVSPWLSTGPLPFRCSGWNCSGTLCITASELLSADGATVSDGEEHGSSSGRDRKSTRLNSSHVD